MSRKEPSQLNIADVAVGAFQKYSAHMDYTAGDCLIQLLEGNESKSGRKQTLGGLLDFIRAVGLDERADSGNYSKSQPVQPEGDEPEASGFIMGDLFKLDEAGNYVINGKEPPDQPPTSDDEPNYKPTEVFKHVIDYAVAYMLYCAGLASLKQAYPDEYDKFYKKVTLVVEGWGNEALRKIIQDNVPDFTVPSQWQQDLLRYINEKNQYGQLNPPDIIIDPSGGDGSQVDPDDSSEVEPYGKVVYVWEDTQWVKAQYGKWFHKRDIAGISRDDLANVNEELREVQGNMISFLDRLLVKNDEFLKIYMTWLLTLARIESKIGDILSWISSGVPPSLHYGKLFFSATADTDRKAREDFGGIAKWERILNFPLLVYNSDSYEERNNVRKRGGESFVSLTKDNIPNHTHTLTGKGMQLMKGVEREKDKWKPPSAANGSTHPGSDYVSDKTPGLQWKSKNVYPEIAPLNWCDDVNGIYKGAARYVRPHFNIPPYKDVYIWQYNYTPPDGKARSTMIDVDEPNMPPVVYLEGSPNPEKVSRTDSNEVSFFDIPSAKPPYSDNWNVSSLQVMGVYDSISMLVSDMLQGEEQWRYDSKDASLKELSGLASWYVWYDFYHVERKYLYRDVYRYLLTDIQDRIYELIRSLATFLSDVKNGGMILPEKLVRGQYVFFYGITTSEAQAFLETHYRKPDGCNFIPINSQFLRGTSIFTEETSHLFRTYCMDPNKERLASNIRTGGGLQTVSLYSDNFPKHLHWSTLMSPKTSMSITRPGTKTGGYGSAITTNDPRSGGVKYDYTTGAGPYQFSMNPAGTDKTITHTNIPNYVVMQTYLVM